MENITSSLHETKKEPAERGNRSAGAEKQARAAALQPKEECDSYEKLRKVNFVHLAEKLPEVKPCYSLSEDPALKHSEKLGWHTEQGRTARDKAMYRIIFGDDKIGD